jgi:hypothetical protein
MYEISVISSSILSNKQLEGRIMIDPDKNTGTSVSPFIGFVSVDLSGGWDDILEDAPAHIAEHSDSTADALILSLTTKGCVDIDYIAALTGEDIKSVISSLKGSIYQNPDTWCGDLSKGWETKEEYLSSPTATPPKISISSGS